MEEKPLKMESIPDTKLSLVFVSPATRRLKNPCFFSVSEFSSDSFSLDSVSEFCSDVSSVGSVSELCSDVSSVGSVSAVSYTHLCSFTIQFDRRLLYLDTLRRADTI